MGAQSGRGTPMEPAYKLERMGDPAAYVHDVADGVQNQELFYGARRSGESDPCKQLLLAVLEDARNIVVHKIVPAGTKHKDMEIARTRRWFKSDENWGLFSFVGVCEWLELDHMRIRNKVLG